MLRVGKMTDYALVLLTYFARDTERPVYNARDLSIESKLPLPTVSKILKILARGSLLESQRGATGGYRLAKAPDEMSIASILTIIEGPVAMTECSATPPGDPSTCEFQPYCPIQKNWRRITGVVSNALEKLTLADMTCPVQIDSQLLDADNYLKVMGGNPADGN